VVDFLKSEFFFKQGLNMQGEAVVIRQGGRASAIPINRMPSPFQHEIASDTLEDEDVSLQKRRDSQNS